MSNRTLTRMAVIKGILARGLGYGCVGGAFLGTLFGTLIVPIFGTLSGLLIGAVVGAAAGLANSVIFCLLTLCCFYPLRHPRTFTWVSYSFSMYLTFVVSLGGFALLRSGRDGLLIPRITDDFTFVQLPTAIACVYSTFVVYRGTRWYVEHAPSAPATTSVPRWLHLTFIALGSGIAFVPVLWFVQQRAQIVFRGVPNEEIIIFTNNQSYLMRIAPDGTSEARLTYHIDPSALNTSVSTIQPQRAPNGQGIVYLSDHAPSERGLYDYQFYQLRLDGSPAKRIPTWLHDNRDVRLSPDGQKLLLATKMLATSTVLSQTDDLHLKVMAIDHWQEWCLSCTIAPVFAPTPAWSFDGQQIAFSVQRGDYAQIFIGNWDGSKIVQLTRTDDADNIQPAWSPDGQWLAFVRRQGQSRNIMVMRSGGSDIRQLTSSGSDDQPAWSPDGTKIVFTSFRAGRKTQRLPGNSTARDLYVMQADGSQQRRLTFGDGDYTEPVWVRVPTK